MSSEGGCTVLFERAARGVGRLRLRRFAERLRAEVTGGAGFNCLLTGDAELQRLNRQFLGHDTPTDVLSFPAPDAATGWAGEIAISLDRARAQAQERGHALEEEIEILMLHGALHLAGMDHDADRGRMACAEKKWRRRLDLPTGLIERARP